MADAVTLNWPGPPPVSLQRVSLLSVMLALLAISQPAPVGVLVSLPELVVFHL